MRAVLVRVALALLVVALIPAAILALRRVQSEGRHVSVAMVIDEQALACRPLPLRRLEQRERNVIHVMSTFAC